MWAEPRPFKDCVRFNLGFADDIDQRIIKGKRTRASMQLHSWFLRVFMEVRSWSHDCQTASGSSDLDPAPDSAQKVRVFTQRRADCNVSWRRSRDVSNVL